MLALRYMRARRRPKASSVIAGFSFLGIMLGVATLIIVMSVMNGFRKELLDKILGVNGHLFVQALESPLTDYDGCGERIAKVEGMKLAMPMVEGAGAGSTPVNATGVLVRGMRESDLKKLPSIAGNMKLGTLDGFDEGQGVAIGSASPTISLRAGDNITLVSPRAQSTPFGTTPRIKPIRSSAIFEIGMSEYDARSSSCR
jgi:lipoprotein-releasing system permease protein